MGNYDWHGWRPGFCAWHVYVPDSGMAAVSHWDHRISSWLFDPSADDSNLSAHASAQAVGHYAGMTDWIWHEQDHAWKHQYRGDDHWAGLRLHRVADLRAGLFSLSLCQQEAVILANDFGLWGCYPEG